MMWDSMRLAPIGLGGELGQPAEQGEAESEAVCRPAELSVACSQAPLIPN